MAGEEERGASRGPQSSKMPRKFKYRILLVDDEEELLQTASDVLTRGGYLVGTARDGFEALAVLRGGQPEILISDLKLPNMSGFELLAVIRKRFPGIGVIAYSCEFSPLGPEGVLADRFLRKGDNSSFELLEEIRDLLEELPLRGATSKTGHRTNLAPALRHGIRRRNLSCSVYARFQFRRAISNLGWCTTTNAFIAVQRLHFALTVRQLLELQPSRNGQERELTTPGG